MNILLRDFFLLDWLTDGPARPRYNIFSADKEKVEQACVATSILLGQSTVLCYALFAETVYLTSEGAVEKFKDGQVCVCA